MPCSRSAAAVKLERYETAIRIATDLENLVKFREAGLLVLHEAGGVPPGSSLVARLRQAWMAYKCTAQPWVYRLLALGLAVFSFLIIWSEATIGFGRDLSPFSHVRDCLHLPCHSSLMRHPIRHMSHHG